VIFVFVIVLVVCIASSRALKQAGSSPREVKLRVSPVADEAVLTGEQLALFRELLEKEKQAVIQERDAWITDRDRRLAEMASPSARPERKGIH
jgi:hypothetical protein